MARDGRLPFGNAIARVSGRRKVPIVPALVTGIITLGILALNIANQSAFVALTARRDHHVLPLLPRHHRPDAACGGCAGTWPRPDHGPITSRSGAGGLLVNLAAVIYGAVVAFNIAWPRAARVRQARGTSSSAAYEFIGATIVLGAIWYFSVYARKPIEVIEAHRADPQFDLRTPVGLGEMAP